MLLHLIKHIIELEQNKKHMLVKNLTLVVFFYLLYLFDWLRGVIKYRKNWDEARDLKGNRYASASNKAYYRIRAEQEAYACQGFENYLDSRKRYQWTRYYRV